MRGLLLSSVIISAGFAGAAPAMAAGCCYNSHAQTVGSTTISVEQGVTVMRPGSTIDVNRAERIAYQERKYKAQQDYLNYAADRDAANRNLERERLAAQQERQDRNLDFLERESRNINTGNYYGREGGLYAGRNGGFYSYGW